MGVIPQSLEEITPEWLTQALRAGWHIGAATRVESVGVDRIAEGVGFLGLLARLSLTYTDEGDGPRTLVAKMPTAESGPRALAMMFGVYEREIRFYEELRSLVGFHSPRSYYAAKDVGASKFFLLLEDLAASGRAGDQVAGCTDAEALLAMRELARMHAAWWESPRFARLPWLQGAADLFVPLLQSMYEPMLPVFLERYGDALPAAFRAALPSLNRHALAIIDDLGRRPQTLAHGDFRLDNMFFGNDGSPYRIALVDWQGFGRGSAAGDVEYFLCTNLSVEQRRRIEGDVLAAYCEVLADEGVRGFTSDDLREDCRRLLLLYLAGGVIGGTTMEPTNQRALQLFEALLQRFVAAVTDAEALALLPSSG